MAGRSGAGPASTEKRGAHVDSPLARHSALRIEHISSLANTSVKLLRGLDRKKQRTETGLFLAEGGRLIEEGLEHGWRPSVLLLGASAVERPRTAGVIERAHAAGARIYTASAKVMEAVARKDNPQTMIAAFHQRTSTLADLPASGTRRWIALYEVRDPGNLGTIIRTADAAGVDGVILAETCCDLFSVEAVRASMGSIFAVPVVVSTLDDLLAWKIETGARLAAASINATRRPDEITYGGKSIVLMGNEQAGLPASLEGQCDDLVRIPMRGTADSLNLAVASALMIYEVWRKAGYAPSSD